MSKVVIRICFGFAVLCFVTLLTKPEKLVEKILPLVHFLRMNKKTIIIMQISFLVFSLNIPDQSKPIVALDSLFLSRLSDSCKS